MNVNKIDEMIEGNFHGFAYKITQETLDDLANHFGINAIFEIERGVDLALKGIEINPVVDLIDKTVTLAVIKHIKLDVTEEEKKFMIVKFRERFGVGRMEAKKILTETNYDYDRAVKLFTSNKWFYGRLC